MARAVGAQVAGFRRQPSGFQQEEGCRGCCEGPKSNVPHLVLSQTLPYWLGHHSLLLGKGSWEGGEEEGETQHVPWALGTAQSYDRSPS